MREVTRLARIVKLIFAIWAKVPDWRFAQLMYNIMVHMNAVRKYQQYATYKINGIPVETPLNISIDPFYLEDDEFEAELKKISEIGLSEWFKQNKPV